MWQKAIFRAITLCTAKRVTSQKPASGAQLRKSLIIFLSCNNFLDQKKKDTRIASNEMQSKKMKISLKQVGNWNKINTMFNDVDNQVQTLFFSNQNMF